MSTIGIIPARYHSVRFPGKPLVNIAGKSMIQRVYEQATKCGDLEAVVVATDDDRIYEHVSRFGGRVVLTSHLHKSGTDRCAEVIQMPEFMDFQIVINIQGDEPFIDPAQISEVVAVLKSNDQFQIATLAKRSKDKACFLNPHKVKAVTNAQGKALYFSRSPIPSQNNNNSISFLKHIGIYAFIREVLLALNNLSISNLEKMESLEQLRWLENGYTIGVGLTEFESLGIDTPSDIENLDFSLLNDKM